MYARLDTPRVRTKAYEFCKRKRPISAIRIRTKLKSKTKKLVCFFTL
jgi:hypothetical protein